MSNFNPGPVVTVGALNVGDTVYLRTRRMQDGLPVPTHPVTVADVEPYADGRVQVTVRAANADASGPTKSLGRLPATREFRSAVAAV
ncbi:hypothetical protein AB0P00_15995 [Microbacterium sp. NPDC077057]|uniref:hypothetical protein n=1 Tax=Microbacterium sp. NPDC077057 TaxID=3154763 RepID=UPI00341FC836